MPYSRLGPRSGGGARRSSQPHLRVGAADRAGVLRTVPRRRQPREPAGRRAAAAESGLRRGHRGQRVEAVDAVAWCSSPADPPAPSTAPGTCSACWSSSTSARGAGTSSPPLHRAGPTRGRSCWRGRPGTRREAGTQRAPAPRGARWPPRRARPGSGCRLASRRREAGRQRRGVPGW